MIDKNTRDRGIVIGIVVGAITAPFAWLLAEILVLVFILGSGFSDSSPAQNEIDFKTIVSYLILGVITLGAPIVFGRIAYKSYVKRKSGET